MGIVKGNKIELPIGYPYATCPAADGRVVSIVMRDDVKPFLAISPKSEYPKPYSREGLR